MRNPEMSAPMLALYLRRIRLTRIRLTRSVPALNAVADEIERDSHEPRQDARFTVTGWANLVHWPRAASPYPANSANRPPVRSARVDPGVLSAPGDYQ